MLTHADTRGTAAERQAEAWLQQQGLRPIERNYRCRVGEIDLIMRHGEQLVFVEVKFRRQSRFGAAVEMVDARKQQKLRRAAQFYLQSRKLTEQASCRFDVVGVQPAAGNGNTTHQFQWIRDAF